MMFIEFGGMSSSAIGLFFILMVSLEKVQSEDDNQDFVISDDKYLNSIVAFWGIFPEEGKRELLCLGASVGFNLIFISKYCYDLLGKSNNTVICTGSSYFDDNYMDFIIESTQELNASSQFILIIINLDISSSSRLPIDYIKLHKGGKYRGVLVGWSAKKAQPMIEPFTCTLNGLKMEMEDDDNRLSEKDFALGSLVVMDGRIMALSNTNIYLKPQFHRILSADSISVRKIISNPFIADINLFRKPEIDDKKKTAIMPGDYTNILVSLWKMISENDYYILCLGALIRSNLIFTTTQCSDKLDLLSDVGVLTGINKITDRPEKILHRRQPFREKSNFITLVLKRDFELTSSIRIGVVTIGIDEIDTNGVLLGWNEKTGRKKSSVSFKNGEKFLSLDGIENHCDGDFPEGSIAIKGRNIIGFTYLDEQNNANEKSILDGTRIITKKKFTISKIFYKDFTKVNSLLREGADDDIVLTDEDYFNFVVSLWEHKNSEKYEILCLGALIKSNLILINTECLEKVVKCPLDNIGILTYGMYRERHPPKTKVIDYSRIIRNKPTTSNYIILFLNSNFTVLSRIKADWAKHDNPEGDLGIIVGWQKEKGPVKQSFNLSCRRRLRIPISDIQDFASDYPLGSLIIIGQNFRASIHMEEYVKIKDGNGLLNTIKMKSNEAILAYKFMAKDSSRLKSMISETDVSMKKRQKTGGKDSPSKKFSPTWKAKHVN